MEEDDDSDTDSRLSGSVAVDSVMLVGGALMGVVWVGVALNERGPSNTVNVENIRPVVNFVYFKYFQSCALRSKFIKKLTHLFHSPIL